MLKFDLNLLWTVINLIVFFVLMKVFLFKPIKKTLDARKELIAKQFKDAEDANNAAEQKMADYESKIVPVQPLKRKLHLLPCRQLKRLSAQMLMIKQITTFLTNF